MPSITGSPQHPLALGLPLGILERLGIIFQYHRHVWMLLAQRLLQDHQRPLEESLYLLVFAPSVVKQGEGVQGARHIRMLRASSLLHSRQRPLEQILRLGVPPLAIVQQGEADRTGRDARIVLF